MQVDTWAGKLYVNMRDSWIRNHTLNSDGGIYEEHIILGPLKPFIEKSKFIVDVGANNGNHTLAYAKLSKDVNIYSFEPQKDMFKHLKNTVESNEYKNISLYQCCLGHKCMTVEMSDILSETDDNGNINLGGIGIGSGGEICLMKTLDSLDLPGLDFMKIDVEGAESLVIQGAKTTIEKYKPVIFFEHNIKKLNVFVDDLTSPFYELSKLGYKTFVYTDWDNYIAFHNTVEDTCVNPCKACSILS
jgi:FkbM family methyltransferase